LNSCRNIEVQEEPPKIELPQLSGSKLAREAYAVSSFYGENSVEYSEKESFPFMYEI
jgi:hypothetical protein